jgi:cell division protein FtsB
MRSAVALGIGILVFATVASENGTLALRRARQDTALLATEIAALRAQNARLRAEAEALRADPDAIEAVARQTLGLARPGEIVVTRGR